MKCITKQELKKMSKAEKCRVMKGIINKKYYLEGQDEQMGRKVIRD